MNFRVETSDAVTAARTGIITTSHSQIETPVFMPVGTQATVKAVTQEMLEALDARIILGNTYHLFLRPGTDTIARLGGLHGFMSWPRSVLTDSGGFQVFSLGELRKIREDGVEFRSHLDGSLQFLSPEVSIKAQRALGADIIMAFDECTPFPATESETRRSMELSMRWARRSRREFELYRGTGDNQSLFGIIQGGVFPDLRRESLECLVETGFEGYAIGGLSVGEEKSVMYEVVADIAPRMPAEKPRYLMGVGTPEDLIECVASGVDMFDCVMPTRNARNGQAFTSEGRVNLRNAAHTADDSPIDGECQCSVCRRYSRAYIRHLFQCHEILASTLCTYHNLAFYLDTMRRIRQAIRLGEFAKFRAAFTEKVSMNRVG